MAKSRLDFVNAVRQCRLGWGKEIQPVLRMRVCQVEIVMCNGFQILLDILDLGAWLCTWCNDSGVQRGCVFVCYSRGVWCVQNLFLITRILRLWSLCTSLMLRKVGWGSVAWPLLRTQKQCSVQLRVRCPSCSAGGNLYARPVNKSLIVTKSLLDMFWVTISFKLAIVSAMSVGIDVNDAWTGGGVGSGRTIDRHSLCRTTTR